MGFLSAITGIAKGARETVPAISQLEDIGIKKREAAIREEQLGFEREKSKREAVKHEYEVNKLREEEEWRKSPRDITDISNIFPEFSKYSEEQIGKLFGGKVWSSGGRRFTTNGDADRWLKYAAEENKVALEVFSRMSKDIGFKVAELESSIKNGDKQGIAKYGCKNDEEATALLAKLKSQHTQIVTQEEEAKKRVELEFEKKKRALPPSETDLMKDKTERMKAQKTYDASVMNRDAIVETQREKDDAAALRTLEITHRAEEVAKLRSSAGKPDYFKGLKAKDKDDKYPAEVKKISEDVMKVKKDVEGKTKDDKIIKAEILKAFKTNASNLKPKDQLILGYQVGLIDQERFDALAADIAEDEKDKDPSSWNNKLKKRFNPVSKFYKEKYGRK